VYVRLKCLSALLGLRFLVGVSPGGCYPDRGQVVRGCTEMCAATVCDRCWQHKYRMVGPEYVCMWGWVNMYRDMGGGGRVGACAGVNL
jgi:hypothetical protein